MESPLASVSEPGLKFKRAARDNLSYRLQDQKPGQGAFQVHDQRRSGGGSGVEANKNNTRARTDSRKETFSTTVGEGSEAVRDLVRLTCLFLEDSFIFAFTSMIPLECVVTLGRLCPDIVLLIVAPIRILSHEHVLRKRLAKWRPW